MNYVLYLEFCHSIYNKVHFHSVFNPVGHMQLHVQYFTHPRAVHLIWNIINQAYT